MNKISFLFTGIFIIALLVSCENKIGKLEPKASAALVCDSIKWTKHIKPMIDASCAKSGCHTASGPQSNLSTYAGLKIKIDNGIFKTRVFDSPTSPMPKDVGMFAQSRLDSIKCWLDRGAPND